MSEGANGKAGNVTVPEEHQRIQERLISIGYDASGELVLEVSNNIAPAVAIVMLEQMKFTMVRSFHFRRERKVDLVPGAALGSLPRQS